MSSVVVTDRSGREFDIAIRPGVSLMQAITDAGVSDLLALCGGVCSCATCHVYIEEGAQDILPPIEPDEDALLQCSEHRQPNSRLSCQIRLNHELNGLRATVAPEE